MKARFLKLSPTRSLLLGYCIIIFIGTVLLSLPAAVRAGTAPTPISDAFFTAASATCVTGLVRFDTFTHWSLFGQLVILCLIQIGGLGFVTITIFMVGLTKKKIGLGSRFLMQEAISAPQLGGIVRMTKFILLGTVLIEMIGAVLLAFHFCPQMGIGRGLYYAVFHSISAFCNAGFDLMGAEGPFSSLVSQQTNWYVNLIIMSLIVVGGLGFFVWQDILETRGRFKKMRLHSKLVLVVTLLLIFGGAALIFLLETLSGGFAGMGTSDKALVSLFQSVTSRTAGFNTVDLTTLSEGSIFLITCLMLVGGSTGSTAGGVKTTTLTVLILSVFSTFRKQKNVEIFGRRMEDGISRTASCIFMMYLSLTIIATLIISSAEQAPILESMFESASAIGTVGLTLGMTPSVSMVSKMTLAFLMIFGRAGSLTMLLALAADRAPAISKKPLEKIQMG